MNFKSILLTIISAFIFSQSFSQLVNVEKRRKREKDTIIASVALALSFMKNTKEAKKLTNNLSLEWDKNQNTFLIYNEIAYSSIDGVDILNNGYQHIRYNYTFQKPDYLIFEFFFQNQYNKIKLIEHRNIVGGGPRFKINESEKFYLYLSPLFMYEREALSDGLSTVTSKFKGDFYLSTGIIVNDVFSISHVIYYQPDIKQFNDFRLFSETSFAFKAFKRLTFSFDYEFSYDSDPPIDYNLDIPLAIPRLFYTLENVITFKF